MELTAEHLRRIMRYEPDSGFFHWVESRKGVRPNRPAGCVSKAHGYRTICIDRVWHRAHRLAWLYMTGEWPSHEIDHIDRNRANNAWANLREATHQQNAMNMGVRRNNKSGFIGVSWDARREKWHAQIRLNGKKKNLGRFDDKQQAIDAWQAAAQMSLPQFRGVHGGA